MIKKIIIDIKIETYSKAFAATQTIIILIILSLLLMLFILMGQINKDGDTKALIVQLADFDAAIGQFYSKYGALPGDIKSTIKFELSESDSDGNDNGVIEDKDGLINGASGEITNFWMHLSKSGFITHNFDGAKNENSRIGNTFPRSKIAVDRGITVFGHNGKNYYQIGVMGADSNNVIMSDSSLTPMEAATIDIKIDDGLPKSGRTLAASGVFVNGIGKDSKCVFNDEYNTRISVPSCQLRIEIGAVNIPN